jgi:hypothetical protein
VRRLSLASDARREGNSLEITWSVGLKANESENATVPHSFALNPRNSGFFALRAGSPCFHTLYSSWSFADAWPDVAQLQRTDTHGDYRGANRYIYVISGFLPFLAPLSRSLASPLRRSFARSILRGPSRRCWDIQGELETHST